MWEAVGLRRQGMLRALSGTLRCVVMKFITDKVLMSSKMLNNNFIQLFHNIM